MGVKNSGLKEVLNKALAEPTLPTKVGTPTEVGAISLESLKEKIKTVNQNPIQNKDRSASLEDMNKLKNLIQQKVEVKKEEITTPAKATHPQQGGEDTFQKPIPVKEVPEDVLRKILE
jgi:uncharacterized protein YfkK (UPF0435 family)